MKTILLGLCVAVVLPVISQASAPEDGAADTRLNRWKDNAAAKTTMDELIANLAAGNMAAAMSRVVVPDETNKNAVASVRSWFDNWSGDLRSGCYTSRALCVKTDGTWGIAFFVHLKGNLGNRDSASKRFGTPNEDVNHWGMACYHFQDGWRLVPPFAGEALPGFKEFIKDFQKGVRPLHDAVKKQYKDVDITNAVPLSTEVGLERTAVAYVEIIKAVLPAGWKVAILGEAGSIEQHVLVIARDSRVEAVYTSPVGAGPQPLSEKYVIKIRIGDRITKERYDQMAAENRKVREELLAKHPNYDPIDNPISRRLPHVLPTHFDDQHSFQITSLLDKGNMEFKSKEVFEECSRVYVAVKKLFSSYAAPAGRQRTL